MMSLFILYISLNCIFSANGFTGSPTLLKFSGKVLLALKPLSFLSRSIFELGAYVYILFEDIVHCFILVLCSDLFYFIQQVTDYAIARRIVDLHSHCEESVERVYSVEDMRRYILFTRQFKPQVCVSFFRTL